MGDEVADDVAEPDVKAYGQLVLFAVFSLVLLTSSFSEGVDATVKLLTPVIVIDGTKLDSSCF